MDRTAKAGCFDHVIAADARPMRGRSVVGGGMSRNSTMVWTAP
jgi:hypothetical protein